MILIEITLYAALVVMGLLFTVVACKHLVTGLIQLFNGIPADAVPSKTETE